MPQVYSTFGKFNNPANILLIHRSFSSTTKARAD
jgi:hypothetical protein